MSKVTLQGYIIVPDTQLVEVQAALKIHIALTRQEQGCILFEVTQDEDDKNRFNVYEEFTDSESFTAHQTRVGASAWGVVSKGLVREYQISGMDIA